MSENTVHNNVGNEEIDLLELFRRIGKTIGSWIRAISRAFLITFFYILRKWLPLGLSIAAGLGLSYILKLTSDSFYTSDLILRTNVVANSDMINYINRLNNYDKKVLKDVMTLSPTQAKNILNISAYWIIDKNHDGSPDYIDYKNNHDVYDTVNVRMLDRLDVRVKITVPQELSIIKNGIIKYVESDSLFQQRNRLRLMQNQALLSRLSYDIVQLDSLQKIKYFEETKNMLPKNGGQMIFLQEQKTQLVYEDIYKLYDRKQKLELDNDLFKGIVTVVSDFSLPAKRSNGTLYYGKTLIPLSLFFTLLILVVWGNRKKLVEISKRY